MPDNYNQNNDAAAKVERMNHIFDHVVLPMIAFTVIMIVVSSFVFNPSCKGEKEDAPAQPDSYQNMELDAYLMREVLLEDMENNSQLFEQGGYTIVETEQSGIVAYRELEDGTQIFDNVTDGSGGRYSAVMLEKDGAAVTLRIYSDSIFLVEAVKDGQMTSAIFRDDRFATWTSGSDADAGEVLSMVSADRLCGMIESYKTSILSLVKE